MAYAVCWYHKIASFNTTEQTERVLAYIISTDSILCGKVSGDTYDARVEYRVFLCPYDMEFFSANSSKLLCFYQENRTRIQQFIWISTIIKKIII